MPSQVLYCASCARPSGSDPDAVKTVQYLGTHWCMSCAAIRKAPKGGVFGDQPSPGRMMGAPLTDPLDAWMDCYSMKPKRRISIKRAKAEVQRAWRRWDGDKSGTGAGLIFFGWLRRYRPYFLTFRAKGDPWQTVHSWLSSAEAEDSARTSQPLAARRRAHR